MKTCSLTKPNAVVVKAGFYKITRIGEKVLELESIPREAVTSMPARNVLAISPILSANAPEYFLVYGTDREDIIVEGIK